MPPRSPLQLVLVLLLQLVLAGAACAQQEGPWFSVDSLNPGLGEAPANIDRATPRAMMESLLARGERNDWDAAAHLLDLSDYPEDEQAAVGPNLAQDLLTVIRRKMVIDWYELPDRPDALDAQASSDAAMGGEPRKSLRLWIMDLPEHPVAIRINRLKPEGGDPAWVVSRQTVEMLPLLAARYGPSQIEMMLPDVLRQSAFWGLRWWEVITLPLALAAALCAGILVHRLMSKSFRASNRRMANSFITACRGPAVLTAVTFVLATISQELFVFSGRIETVLGPSIVIGYVAAVVWLVVNVADTILNRLVQFDGGELRSVGEGQERRRAIATRVAAARRAIIVIVAVFGTGIVLREASLMQTLGVSLMASAGVMTLVLAFAARNVLSNIMSSMQISLNQSARIGDRLLYKGEICSVERIHFTFVQLRIWTGERLVVPVEEFASENFENWTMQEPFLIREVRLRLAHDADIDALREKYYEIMKELDGEEEIEPDSRGVFVAAHDVFGQEALFLVPCADPNAAWARSCEVRERLLGAARSLADEGRKIFPEVNPAEGA